MGLKTITSETDGMRGLVKKAVLLEKYRKFLLTLRKSKLYLLVGKIFPNGEPKST